jgi:hypothetical protein
MRPSEEITSPKNIDLFSQNRTATTAPSTRYKPKLNLKSLMKETNTPESCRRSRCSSARSKVSHEERASTASHEHLGRNAYRRQLAYMRIIESFNRKPIHNDFLKRSLERLSPDPVERKKEYMHESALIQERAQN